MGLEDLGNLVSGAFKGAASASRHASVREAPKQERIPAGQLPTQPFTAQQHQAAQRVAQTRIPAPRPTTPLIPRLPNPTPAQTHAALGMVRESQQRAVGRNPSPAAASRYQGEILHDPSQQGFLQTVAHYLAASRRQAGEVPLSRSLRGEGLPIPREPNVLQAAQDQLGAEGSQPELDATLKLAGKYVSQGVPLASAMHKAQSSIAMANSSITRQVEEERAAVRKAEAQRNGLPTFAVALPVLGNVNISKGIEDASKLNLGIGGVPGKLLNEVVDLPAQTLLSGGMLGSATTRAIEGNPGMLLQEGQQVVHQFTHPWETFKQAPLSTALTLAGAEGGIGSAAGRLARTGALGDTLKGITSTARGDLKLYGERTIPVEGPLPRPAPGRVPGSTAPVRAVRAVRGSPITPADGSSTYIPGERITGRRYNPDPLRKGVQVLNEKLMPHYPGRFEQADPFQATGRRLERAVVGGVVKPGKVDVAQTAGEHMRAQMVGDALKETLASTVKPKHGGAAQVPIFEGIATSPGKAPVELAQRLKDLQDAQHGLYPLTGPKVPLKEPKPLVGEDLAHNLKAQEAIKSAIAHPPTAETFAKTRQIVYGQRPVTAGRVALGGLDAQQLRASLFPYMQHHMGARYYTAADHAAAEAAASTPAEKAAVGGRGDPKAVLDHERILKEHAEARSGVSKAQEDLRKAELGRARIGASRAPSRASGGKLENVLRRQAPEASFGVTERQGRIDLHKVVVPQAARQQGIGDRFMKALTGYADAHGAQVRLNPDVSFGASSRGRLVSFYKRYGFVENKGPNKDFSIGEGMYRQPVKGGVRGIAAKAGGGDARAAADAKVLGARERLVAANERHQAARTAAAESKLPPRQAGMRKANGEYLSTEEVLKHMEDHGVPTPGFLSHVAPRTRSGLFGTGRSRPALESHQRTGASFINGTYDHSRAALLRQTQNENANLAAHMFENRKASRFDIGRGFQTKEAAEAYADNFRHTPEGKRIEEGLGPLVPQTIAPKEILAKGAIEPPHDAHAVLKQFGLQEHTPATEGQGQWTLRPQKINDRFSAHGNVRSRSKVGRAMEAWTQSWRRAKLYTSTRHYLGVAQELGIRLAAESVVPKFLGGRAGRTGAKFRENLATLADDKGPLGAQYRELSGILGSRGSLFTSSAARDIINKGDRWQRTSMLSYIGKGREASIESRAAGAALKPWRAFYEMMQKGMHKVEGQTYDAMLGKAVSEFFGGYRTVLKMQDDAMRQMIAGKLDANTADALAHRVDDMMGNWSHLTPDVRHAVQKFTPFGLWWLNSMRWLYRLPVTHPVKTGIAAALYNATRTERNKEGQGYDAAHPVPGFLTGDLNATLPILGKVKLNPTYYSPMGVGIEPLKTASDLVAPSLSGIYSAARNQNPLSGAILTQKGNKPITFGQSLSNVLGEIATGPIPGATQAQQALQMGGKPYGTANLLTDIASKLGGQSQVKPGTERSVPEVLLKILAPERFNFPGKAKSGEGLPTTPSTPRDRFHQQRVEQAVRAQEAASSGVQAFRAARVRRALEEAGHR